MAEIIEKHDNDRVIKHTCKCCGTIFTERERNLYVQEYHAMFETILSYYCNCPNCKRECNVDISECLK